MVETTRITGITGIRPQDFYGHCPQCHIECQDDMEKFIQGKFGLGFEVEDKYGNPESTAKREKFITKEYPSGSTSGGDADSTFIPISVARCTNLGDIRIGYSDAYDYFSNDTTTRELDGPTHMKKPERYYAEKAIPKPSQGSLSNEEYKKLLEEWEAAIYEWIMCRHKNTDHVDTISISGGGAGGELDTTIDDCVSGIWNGPEIFNVVDTFTTIEEIDVYAKMDFFSTYPLCAGSQAVQSSAKNDVAFFTVDEDEDVHDFEFSGFSEGFDDLETMRGKAFNVLVSHFGTQCRDHRAKRSLHPHWVGVSAGNGTDYRPTGKNGPDPKKNRGRGFKTGPSNKAIGLYRQTHARMIGSIYKTTVTAPINREDFQQQTGDEFWTILHPTAPGTETIHGESNFWYDSGCANSYGSPMLLQLPCEVAYGMDNTGNMTVCDRFLDHYCTSQDDNIFDTFQEAADTLAKRQRRKLVKGSAPRIEPENCSALLTFSKTVEGFAWGTSSNPPIDGWGDAAGIGRGDRSYEGRTSPLELDWSVSLNGFIIKNPTQHNTTNFPLEPDYHDHYDIRAKYYKQYDWNDPYYGFKHCGHGSGDILISISFYTAALHDQLIGFAGQAATMQSYPLDFRLIKRIDFKLDKETVPTGYGIGGVHADMEDSLKAWTCVRSRQTDDDYRYTKYKQWTDYLSAGIYYRYSYPEKYDYEIEKKVGVYDETIERDQCVRGDQAFGDDMKEVDPNYDCLPIPMDWRYVSSRWIDADCNLKDVEPECGRDSIRMTIFTGAGSPPPRYDVGQRVGKAGPCTIIYDDISNLNVAGGDARESILRCYKEGRLEPPESIKCYELDDEGKRVQDEDGKDKFEICLQDDKYIYAVHREYFKVNVPDPMYSCGETIGKGGDLDVCTAQWPCETCCGLVPEGGDPDDPDAVWLHIGCAKCTKFKKEVYADVAGNMRCRNYCTEDFCCGYEIQNPYCLDENGKTDPNLCGDFDPEAGFWYNGPFGILGIPGSYCDNPWTCTINGYLPGPKHSPYEHGYLWQTYYGWRPFLDPHRTYDGISCFHPVRSPASCIRLADRIDGCCIGEDDPDYIPCTLIGIPRVTDSEPLDIDLGPIPVNITLRSPVCNMRNI